MTNISWACMHIAMYLPEFSPAKLNWAKLLFVLVRLRIILGGPRHALNWQGYERKTVEVGTPNTRAPEVRFLDRHELKPNRKFDLVRGQVDRNSGRFSRVFSIQFSISSLVIVRYRRIEPKFGSPNFSNVFIFISLFSAPLHQPERGFWDHHLSLKTISHILIDYSVPCTCDWFSWWRGPKGIAHKFSWVSYVLTVSLQLLQTPPWRGQCCRCLIQRQKRYRTNLNAKGKNKVSGAKGT